MQLELASFKINRVQLGREMALRGQTLMVNPEAIRKTLLHDSAFEDVTVNVAHPGESVRIVHVLDAIEPRVKTAGPGVAFPGFLGSAKTVGEGSTARLEGLSIIQTAEFPEPTSGVLSVRESLIDMSGPAAPCCACSDTANLVLSFRPKAGVTNEKFDAAIRYGSLKLAEQLASLTQGHTPQGIERLTLNSDSGENRRPRVAYILVIRQQGPLIQNFLYGVPTEGLVPTFIHPNELLDGALVSGDFKGGLRVCTALHCNDPVVKSLYASHGQEVDFVGVILATAYHATHQLKERSAQYAAKLARMLHVDGVIVPLIGAGNASIDTMLITKACEETGIKAVTICHEIGGAEGTDSPLSEHFPEADAIVSMGNIACEINVPPSNRVLGGETLCFHRSDKTIDSSTGFVATGHDFFCGAWQMGISGFTAKDF
jgi:glycine reductase complex component B subunit alpha and beta